MLANLLFQLIEKMIWRIKYIYVDKKDQLLLVANTLIHICSSIWLFLNTTAIIH